MKLPKLAEVRKAVAGASGAAATLVSVGLLDGTAEKWTTGILAAATAGLVYLVPNAKPAAETVMKPDPYVGGVNAPKKTT